MAFSQSEYELRRSALEKSKLGRSELHSPNCKLSQEERRKIALQFVACETAFNASFGWQKIEHDDEWEDLRDRFFGKFFPAGELCLEVPFMTWDVERYQHQSQFRAIHDDIHQKCLAALKRCRLDAPWYVLENINHPWYRLHVDDMPEHIQQWPIALLPCPDPCYLVSSDMSCGLIVEVSGPISAFGEPFLGELLKDLPLALTCKLKESLQSEPENGQ